MVVEKVMRGYYHLTVKSILLNSRGLPPLASSWPDRYPFRIRARVGRVPCIPQQRSDEAVSTPRTTPSRMPGFAGSRRVGAGGALVRAFVAAVALLPLLLWSVDGLHASLHGLEQGMDEVCAVCAVAAAHSSPSVSPKTPDELRPGIPTLLAEADARRDDGVSAAHPPARGPPLERT